MSRQQDLHAENLLYASESRHGAGDLKVKAGRAYFIDFGISQRFSPIFGLTNGTTTVPFQQDLGHYPPPEGIEAVNPYAYDMYCMGEVINYFCRVRVTLLISQTDSHFMFYRQPLTSAVAVVIPMFA